jgi:hypothetical protein
LVNPFISLFQCTNNAQHVDSTRQHFYDFPKKRYTLDGFEPGPFVPVADPDPLSHAARAKK